MLHRCIREAGSIHKFASAIKCRSAPPITYKEASLEKCTAGTNRMTSRNMNVPREERGRK